MSSKHFILRVAAGLAVVFILAGCSFQVQQPTLVPTIDIQPTLDAVKQEAAQTVVAGITASAPTEAPTSTLAPSATTAPSSTPLPSFTPVPTLAAPTLAPWTNTPQATNTPITYACTVNEQSPAFGDSFPVNAPFDGKWKVTNTSSDTWGKDAVDFKYISGTKFQEHVDLVDLTADVAHDGTYTVIIDMLAPKTAGRYSTTWAFVQGSKILCPVYLTIVVK